MKSEDELVADFARSQNLNPEMFARAGGFQPLWLGADPVGGEVILLRVIAGATGQAIELARWTAVQGENVKILHDRALYIVQSGIGSMR